MSDMTYAGFWLRAVALVVDAVVLSPALVAYLYLPRPSMPVAVAVHIVLSAIPIAYVIYCLTRWGQTVGKMVADIRVVRLNGAPLSARHAWLRSSVDLALLLIAVPSYVYSLSTVDASTWASLTWPEQARLSAPRDPLSVPLGYVGEAWFWSELVVLLLNKTR